MVDVLLDSNVVIRYAFQADPQHQAVLDALHHLARNGGRLCICNQNLYEFWVAATRPKSVNGLNLEPQRAADEVRILLSRFTLLPEPADLLTVWFQLVEQHKVCGRQAHDARLAALMYSLNVKYLLTMDRYDFTRYPGVTVLSPGNLGAFAPNQP